MIRSKENLRFLVPTAFFEICHDPPHGLVDQLVLGVDNAVDLANLIGCGVRWDIGRRHFEVKLRLTAVPRHPMPGLACQNFFAFLAAAGISVR